MYKTALQNAKTAGETSKVRRYDRGLKVGEAAVWLRTRLRRFTAALLIFDGGVDGLCYKVILKCGTVAFRAVYERYNNHCLICSVVSVFQDDVFDTACMCNVLNWYLFSIILFN